MMNTFPPQCTFSEQNARSLLYIDKLIYFQKKKIENLEDHQQHRKQLTILELNQDRFKIKIQNLKTQNLDLE